MHCILLQTRLIVPSAPPSTSCFHQAVSHTSIGSHVPKPGIFTWENPLRYNQLHWHHAMNSNPPPIVDFSYWFVTWTRFLSFMTTVTSNWQSWARTWMLLTGLSTLCRPMCGSVRSLLWMSHRFPTMAVFLPRLQQGMLKFITLSLVAPALQPFSSTTLSWRHSARSSVSLQRPSLFSNTWPIPVEGLPIIFLFRINISVVTGYCIGFFFLNGCVFMLWWGHRDVNVWTATVRFSFYFDMRWWQNFVSYLSVVFCSCFCYVLPSQSIPSMLPWIKLNWEIYWL